MRLEYCTEDVFDSLFNTRPIGYSEAFLSTEVVSLQHLDDLNATSPSTPRLLPNQRETIFNQKRGQLLVCHDMRGNYLNDVSDLGDTFGNAFQFTDWSFIDIFCYFSHNLICIPPVQWINASHFHGCLAMGTFLTEWDEGREVCKKLFSSNETALRLCTLLVNLSRYYHIDGWLINIENPLDPVVEVPVVLFFLHTLREAMHALFPEAKVIWYDAVTTEGSLRWQNKLTSLNKPFFDVCDGLFVNYGWREDTPAVSALLAGMDRRYDIYFGIDVWGRGTYGGGKYCVNKALEVLRRHGVSAAIFAPGYVLESEIDEKQSPLCVQEAITLAYLRFWAPIKEAWVGKRHASAARLECLPLCINFSQAVGNGVRVCGQRFDHWIYTQKHRQTLPSTLMEDNYWFYDLSLQNNNWDMKSVLCTSLCDNVNVALDYEVAFDGTCSLRVSSSRTVSQSGLLPLTRILNMNAELEVVLAIVIGKGGCNVALYLELDSVRGQRTQPIRSNTFELLRTTGHWEIRRYRLCGCGFGRATLGVELDTLAGGTDLHLGLLTAVGAADVLINQKALVAKIDTESITVDDALLSSSNRLGLMISWDNSGTRTDSTDVFGVKDEDALRRVLGTLHEARSMQLCGGPQEVARVEGGSGNALGDFLLTSYAFSSSISVGAVTVSRMFTASENVHNLGKLIGSDGLALLGRVQGASCRLLLSADSPLLHSPLCVEITDEGLLASLKLPPPVDLAAIPCSQYVYKFLLLRLNPSREVIVIRPEEESLQSYLLLIFKAPNNS